jgi:hypothetical protein
MKIQLHLVSLLALITLTAGCSISNSITTDAIGINKSVEDTDNKLILLNIIRASMHRSKFYTDFSRFSGSRPEVQGQLSLQMPIGDNTGIPTIAIPGVATKNSISYDIGIMQSKDFLRGYLNPVSLETVKYYWDIGWSKPMILNLFVSQIKYFSWKKENEKEGKFRLVLDKTIINDPLKGAESYEHFNDELTRLIADGLDMLYVRSGSGEDPRHDNNGGKNGADFEVKHGRPGFVRVNGSMNKIYSETFANKYTLCTQTDMPFRIASDSCNIAYAVNGSHNEKFAVLYLRSPSSVMNYIGDIVRVQLLGDETKQHKKYCPGIFTEYGKEQVPLFIVKEKKDVKEEDIKYSVDYEGKTYVIPKDENDGMSLTCKEYGTGRQFIEGMTPKTMEIIFILNQLTTQFKSNSDFQAVPAVRTIN